MVIVAVAEKMPLLPLMALSNEDLIRSEITGQPNHKSGENISLSLNCLPSDPWPVCRYYS